MIGCETKLGGIIVVTNAGSNNLTDVCILDSDGIRILGGGRDTIIPGSSLSYQINFDGSYTVRGYRKGTLIKKNVDLRGGQVNLGM